MSKLTYLFCVVRSERAPALAGARGVPGGGKPRALDGGGLWLIVGDAPADDYGEDALTARLQDLEWVGKVALAHDAVVARFLGKSVPAKLLTLFNSDARALDDVRKRARALARLLDRLHGRVEWGVRLTLDELSALRRAERSAGGNGRAPSGAAFLQRKKRVRDAQRTVQVDARREADALYEALARGAADARRRPPITQEAAARLLLDAAYLVPSARAAGFRAAVRRHEKRLSAAGYSLTLSGPFAPYNFVA
jgi:hypothetical protein